MNAVVQRDARNADAWNYLGYAYRHLGEMDKSFSHYDKALQIDPDHRGAHEYLGEAYLQVGKLAEAEAQVRALDKICWMPCQELRDLKAKVAAWRKSHPQ
jgi:tetratricopeptide (TPR) repeat protein